MCRWFSATSFCKKKNTQGHDVLNVTAFTSQSSRSKADDERTSDMLSVRETETSTLNNNHHCDLRKLHTNLCCWYCGYAIALFCFFFADKCAERKRRHKRTRINTHTLHGVTDKNTMASLAECCLSAGFVNTDYLISQHFVLWLISLHALICIATIRAVSTMCLILTVCRRLVIE